MDIGFGKAGFETIFAADCDSFAVESFNRYRKEQIAQCLDLEQLAPNALVKIVDASIGCVKPRGVIGGPPCQAFSLANVNRKKRDRRRRLVRRYAEHINALNDKYELDFVVFENVPGLCAKKNKRYLNEFKNSLAQAGFELWEKELNARDFGVAQNRKRVFIVGISRKKFGETTFRFPSDVPEVRTVRDVLHGLPEPAFFKHKLRLQDIPRHPNHWTMRPRSEKLSSRGKKTGRSFRRLNWNRPSWTVAYGNREMHLHPKFNRRISIFEAMLLQGFPRGFRLYGNFSSQVTQVSNAVPPPLARSLARAIADLLYVRSSKLRIILKQWHRANKRSFPWRTNRTPYKIMVAEKMLQQTRATPAVVEVYRTFLRRYPDVHSLASANIQELLEVLHPLGLSYRAQELISAARVIVHKHQGEVPSTLESLKSLPGIGDYAARAIQCFGFDLPSPIVDANIGRFLVRIYGGRSSANPARSRALLALATMLLPGSGVANFNFALLDFCAKVCKATNPNCSSCPLKKDCNHAIAKSSCHRIA
jgi:DNA (cytosine-5)-methyltransferase 1